MLKGTTVVSSAAEAGLAVMEKAMMQVDPSEVKALFQWIHEEVAMVMAMAPVALSGLEQGKMLEEIGMTGNTLENVMSLLNFCNWLTERTMENGPMTHPLATKVLDSVRDQKAEAEAEADGKKNKKKKKQKEKKAKKSKDDASSEGGPADLQGSTNAASAEAVELLPLEQRLDILNKELHRKITQAEEMMVDNFTMSELEKSIQVRSPLIVLGSSAPSSPDLLHPWPPTCTDHFNPCLLKWTGDGHSWGRRGVI